MTMLRARYGGFAHAPARGVDRAQRKHDRFACGHQSGGRVVSAWRLLHPHPRADDALTGGRPGVSRHAQPGEAMATRKRSARPLGRRTISHAIPRSKQKCLEREGSAPASQRFSWRGPTGSSSANLTTGQTRTATKTGMADRGSLPTSVTSIGCHPGQVRARRAATPTTNTDTGDRAVKSVSPFQELSALPVAVSLCDHH